MMLFVLFSLVFMPGGGGVLGRAVFFLIEDIRTDNVNNGQKSPA